VEQASIVVLAEQLAQWCINRAGQGDVSVETLVENFAKMVLKIVAAKAH
jgi:hypothetical protein